jgi:hypothetical protein
MIAPRLFNFHAITSLLNLSLFLIHWKPKPIPSDICCILFIVVMALVVFIELNGCQALLSHDKAIDDLKAHGWDVFLKKFEGYNIQVAKYFAQTFDDFRANIGDIQLELIEDFMSKAIGLPLKCERWFKNAKLEDVPWILFMASCETTCYTKGIPIALSKPRWHSLLLILNQFVTSEGRYGIIFLYHICLLMNFIGFELDMPFNLLMSLYKMSKRYKQ